MSAVDPRDHPLHCFFHGPDRAYSVVDASGPQPSLDDLEPATFTEHDVRSRHADVLKGDVSVAVRSIVIAVNRHHAFDFDASCTGWDQNHGLLLVRVLLFRVRLPHDDVYHAARIASTATPPFLIAASAIDGQTLRKSYLRSHSICSDRPPSSSLEKCSWRR